jgi:integrase/recombinase XerD
MRDLAINYEIANYKGSDVIFLRFPYNIELNEQVKKLVGVQWSVSEKAWYVFDSVFYREKFDLPAKNLIGAEILLKIHPVNQPALQMYIETLQLKAYSPSTIRTYRNEFAQLLYFLNSANVEDLDFERLWGYFLYCTNTLNLSENTLHSRACWQFLK